MVFKTGLGEFVELNESHSLDCMATEVTRGCDNERRREDLRSPRENLSLLWGMPGPSMSPLCR